MLQALYERGIAPDLLVATSVGALNAAFVASRPQTVTTARELGRVWRNLQREDIFPVSMGALVGGLCGRRNHLVPDRGLRQLVRRHLEFDELAGAAIPLHLVAFNLIERRELLLSEGPAVDAVVAAASVPGVFPPVELADRLLIDGGVVNNTPISHAVELGAERIFVLPTRDPGSLTAACAADRARHRDIRARLADRGSTSDRHRSVLARRRTRRTPGRQPCLCATDELRALCPSDQPSAHRRPSKAHAAQRWKAPATRLVVTGRCCACQTPTASSEWRAGHRRATYRASLPGITNQRE